MDTHSVTSNPKKGSTLKLLKTGILNLNSFINPFSRSHRQPSPLPEKVNQPLPISDKENKTVPPINDESVVVQKLIDDMFQECQPRTKAEYNLIFINSIEMYLAEQLYFTIFDFNIYNIDGYYMDHYFILHNYHDILTWLSSARGKLLKINNDPIAKLKLKQFYTYIKIIKKLKKLYLQIHLETDETECQILKDSYRALEIELLEIAPPETHNFMNTHQENYALKRAEREAAYRYPNCYEAQEDWLERWKDQNGY